MPSESTPSSQDRRRNKIKNVLTAVRDNKWSSFNEFLYAFYTSDDETISRQANTSLGYKKGQTFAPEKLLDIWLKNTHGESQQHLKRTVTQKAGEILVAESDRAIKEDSLRISSTGATIPRLTGDFGLSRLAGIYQTLLPCMWMLLLTLLTAENSYERKSQRSKVEKDTRAIQIIVAIISMLLFVRNRATDTFQIIMGIFLVSSGASRRVIDTLNHMGISVSYATTQRCLTTLSTSAKERARNFIELALRLFGVVYDNINFTLRKASQRLDSTTQQLNATTAAIFSLPSTLSRTAYTAALSVLERRRRAFLRDHLTLDALKPTPEKQAHLIQMFRYHIATFLLTHSAEPLSKKHRKRMMKKARLMKPKVRIISSEKTEFYPLPALAQEEASVGGTIKVVTKLFTQILGLAEEVVDAELRLLVGDWLTIRNLRLMKMEIAEETSPFRRMSWVQECAMPFHFQLNAMYMLFRTHLGYPGDNNPSSLEHHRSLLRRSKLDPKKPEYNRAKELLYHSLFARVLDCARICLQLSTHEELRKWEPRNWDDVLRLTTQIVNRFTTTREAHKALEGKDDVLAHAILFLRDALMFYEFSDAIRDGDVGRMWHIYDFWVFMMRGAGCHNYGNEILEMKAQFEHEFPEDLRTVMEHTWLVNRWGTPGRSIPTDLYLEHNNGFIKNMFAASGSNASLEYVTSKASAGVEVLRAITHDVASYFGVSDFHRRHSEVSIEGDLKALLLDLQVQQVHESVPGREVAPSPTQGKKRSSTTKSVSGVRDVLLIGLQMLTWKHLFEYWKRRSSKGGTGLYDGDVEWAENGGDEGGAEEDEAPTGGTAFDNPNGLLDVDVALDPAFEGASAVE